MKPLQRAFNAFYVAHGDLVVAKAAYQAALVAAVREGKREGLTVRAIGRLLGLSHQRVQQIAEADR
jgi:hypothetical protein